MRTVTNQTTLLHTLEAVSQISEPQTSQKCKFFSIYSELFPISQQFNSIQLSAGLTLYGQLQSLREYTITQTKHTNKKAKRECWVSTPGFKKMIIQKQMSDLWPNTLNIKSTLKEIFFKNMAISLQIKFATFKHPA
jgi:hypothetical protein